VQEKKQVWGVAVWLKIYAYIQLDLMQWQPVFAQIAQVK
jgi:hypothetical protein